ncbi:hypothetical protein G7Y89_g11075 [Cudoniella acicularis]|uniref:Uncharacterized protein n=1 Tax=Cudoniella acicularis TaxID=354080 RepID=A0A8H4RD09_9HELO|nr:hypothetical protein G7Y89_g11075 [Cudoniella acicularis]
MCPRRGGGGPMIEITTVLFFLTAFAVGFFYAELSDDSIRIPGLSSIIHVIDAIFSPFVPFFAALALALFFRIYFCPPFPNRRFRLIGCALWIFNFSVIPFTQLFILFLNIAKDRRHGSGTFGMWFQCSLLPVVVGLELIGLKWDRGFLDKIVRSIIQGELKKHMEKEDMIRRENAYNRMEQGIGAQDEDSFIDEKDEKDIAIVRQEEALMNSVEIDSDKPVES